MTLPRLLSISSAAAQLGVPVESLRRAADHHGKTIRIGRAARLHPDDLKELIELCRVAPKAPASTGEHVKTDRQSGRSATEPFAFRPAQQAAQRLKGCSPSTSKGSTAPTGRRDRKS
ncbi:MULTISPECIES: hypothetical protein [Pseudooceanicola]|uniref:hypothetical protein n=1 Tax=Pseudooceanicola TaxID=1679449 RepID=UPI001EF138B8|nr:MULTISPECIES: hypothetical protein [Pseudooceanicola]